MRFVIEIDGINVSETVLELNDIICEAETNNIWDYMLDTFRFVSHINILSKFGLTTEKYYQLEKRKIQVYYNNILFFSGAITHIYYSFVNEEVEIKSDSIGLLASNTPPCHYNEKHNRIFRTSGSFYYGDTLEQIISKIVSIVNYNLGNQGYSSLLTGLSINTIDFTEFMSLNWNPIRIYDGIRKYQGVFWRIGYPNPYLLFSTELATMTNNVALLEIKNSSMDFVTGMEIENPNNPNVTNLRLYFENNKAYEVDITGRIGNLVLYRAQDSLPQEYLDRISFVFSDYNNTGAVYINDPDPGYPEAGYLSIQLNNTDEANYLIRFVRSAEDRFDYNYDDTVSMGKILRDFAILTDSIIWISPDGKIHYQNRIEHNTKTINIESHQLITFYSETTTHSNNQIDLPKEVTIGDEVRLEIIDHYSRILNNRIVRYYYSCPFEAINQNPMMAQVITDDFGDLGIVKRCVLKNDGIVEIMSEKRVENV